VSLLPAIPRRGARIAAADVVAIEKRVIDVVNRLKDIDECEEWRAGARALEAYLRDKELQRPMLGAQRRIEGRIGQLLNEKSKGGRGKKTRSHDYGFFRDTLIDFRLLGRALAGEGELTADEWQKTRRALVALVRLRLGLMPITPPIPDGTYHCIVIDPPWQLDTGPGFVDGTIAHGHDALEYDQMSIDAIRALDIPSLAAPDAHLYLWTTNRYVEDAYMLVRAWDFKPSALLVWCKKPQGIGLGDTFRQTAEFVLFARRGHLPARRIVERTWFEWPRGRHSVKPDAFYELVESVTPEPYLDMFARRARKNWTVWGAEAPKEVKHELSLR